MHGTAFFLIGKTGLFKHPLGSPQHILAKDPSELFLA
jgi:hypothetical protein